MLLLGSRFCNALIEKSKKEKIVSPKKRMLKGLSLFFLMIARRYTAVSMGGVVKSLLVK